MRTWWALGLGVAVLIGAAVYYVWAEGRHRQVSVGQKEYGTYHFEWDSCWFALPADRLVHCGRLHTPSASGRFILPVVIIRDPSEDVRPDPLVYVPGGPGGSAGLSPEEIGYWIDWLEHAQLKRDFILMDPRGTGYSRPKLICSAYELFSQRILQRNARILEELKEGQPILQQCFAELAGRGFEPAHYGSRVSARDLAGLMAKLDEYDQWNLLGVSYGTRLGLLVPDYTQQVRSLILDSVYPPDQRSFQQWPDLLGTALDTFFQWCGRSDCYPEGDLEKDFYRALDQMRDWPVRLSVRRWNGAAPMTVVMNDHRFLSAVFGAIYHVSSWPNVASAVAGALDRDTEALSPLVEEWINLSFSDGFSSLVFMLVDCQDEPAGTEADYLAAVANWPRLAPYTRDFWTHDTCRWLHPEPVALVEGWQPPEVPVLLLAGAEDPITPSRWASALHRRWPGSQLLVMDGIGHGVADSAPCVLAGLRAFLDEPEQPWQPGCD